MAKRRRARRVASVRGVGAHRSSLYHLVSFMGSTVVSEPSAKCPHLDTRTHSLGARGERLCTHRLAARRACVVHGAVRTTRPRSGRSSCP